MSEHSKPGEAVGSPIAWHLFAFALGGLLGAGVGVAIGTAISSAPPNANLQQQETNSQNL